MSAGKVLSVILGALILAIGVVLLIGGGTLVGVDVGFTDEDGFLTTPQADLERDTYAVTAHLLLEGDWIWWWRHPTEAKVRMHSDRPIFLGIASRTEVEAYLADVSYAEIEDLDVDEYRGDRVWATDFRDHVGSSEPKPPGEQAFWKTSVQGEGAQTLRWTIEPGDWLLVAMNADGSRGIMLEGTIGVEAPWLLGLGVGLLAGGALLVAVGLALILVVARQARGGTEPAPTESEPAKPGAYPVTIIAEKTEPLSPALWLVKWLLLIPHFVVLPFLWVGFALFAIVSTGRYPRGLFDYNVGVIRWSWRVAYYSYDALATDRYPPFTLASGGYPADFHVSYPERLSPGLALVKWWLLAIPHYIVVGVFQGGAGFYELGLVFILTVFAGVTLLFTGRYPEDLFRLIVGMNRWTLRVLAYAALMTDEYPPFRLEG